MAPEFPAGAKLTVKRAKGNVRGTAGAKNRKVQVWEIEIPFPGAVRNVVTGAYEIEFTGDDGKKLELSILNEALRFPAGTEKGKANAVCRVDCSRIPSKHFKVSVRAVSCWGKRSAPIEWVNGKEA
jgi:hypothetical protein